MLKLNLWVEDPDVARLDWHCVFDLRDWRVVPTSVCCPMKLHLEDYPCEVGIRHWQTGPPIPILEACARRGFAQVEEDILLNVLNDVLKVSVPDEAEADGDYECDLRLAAMSELMPAWTTTEAHAALHAARTIEHPEQRSDPFLYEEVLSELLTSFEAQTFKQYNAKVTEGRSAGSNDKRTQIRRAKVQKYFKKDPAMKAPIGFKPKAPRYAMPKNPKADHATQFIQKNIPKEIDVIQDDYNGRWKIVSQTGEWRSVSWTRRGFPSACALGMYYAWRFFEDITGATSRVNMEDLAKTVVDLDLGEGDAPE
jgi:hypothetical protein